MSDARSLPGRRCLLGIVLAGLALMFVSAATYLADHPSLTVHSQQAEQAASPAPAGPASAEAGGPPAGMGGAGMTGAGMGSMPDGVVAFMRRLQQNPTDQEALLSLAEHFMHTEDWPKAETFALRAVVAAPNEKRPLYILGIIQHSQNRHAEAADSLRKALASGEDASIRYSLGLLTAYYLDKPEEGLADLRKAADNPTASAELKASAAREIEKLEEHLRHSQPRQDQIQEQSQGQR